MHGRTEGGQDYRGLVKKLELPTGYVAPTELAYEDVRARAISRADLAEDVTGINASLELIRKTRGGAWPTEPVTEDYNYADLVWHEVEFREGDSFAYAVYDTEGRYLGCCYLYPLGRRTPLTEELLSYDVDVSWWVIPVAYEQGYYEKLYAALQSWIEHDFPFETAYYSNAEVPGRGG
ncbi:MAG: GNAT family N-acetyltransferase [Actinomycetota bacterium]